VNVGRITCLLIVAALSSVAHATEKRPIKETDLLAFRWIADPQISPDGSRVVFVRVVVNEEKDRYETALYVVRTDGKGEPQPFSSGPLRFGAALVAGWKTIAFLALCVERRPPGFAPGLADSHRRRGGAAAHTTGERCIGPDLVA
jgi:hypothetical protein